MARYLSSWARLRGQVTRGPANQLLYRLSYASVDQAGTDQSSPGEAGAIPGDEVGGCNWWGTTHYSPTAGSQSRPKDHPGLSRDG